MKYPVEKRVEFIWLPVEKRASKEIIVKPYGIKGSAATARALSGWDFMTLNGAKLTVVNS